MAKNNRGIGLRKIPGRARGKCPLCKRTKVKLLYEIKLEEQTIKVCKQCRHRGIS